jgi:hypothetical protein
LKDSCKSEILTLLSILVFVRTSSTRLVWLASIQYCLNTDAATSADWAIEIFAALAKSKTHGKVDMVSCVENQACHKIDIHSAASFAVNFVVAHNCMASSSSGLKAFFHSSQKSQKIALAFESSFSKSEKDLVA